MEQTAGVIGPPLGPKSPPPKRRSRRFLDRQHAAAAAEAHLERISVCGVGEAIAGGVTLAQTA
jgi:hypothetical protein